MKAIPLFFAFAAFRFLRMGVAGKWLVQALGSPDRNAQMVAGILLVRCGARALGPLRETIESGRALPLTLRVAGDAGLQELKPAIERYASSPDAPTARAAQDALKALS